VLGHDELDLVVLLLTAGYEQAAEVYPVRIGMCLPGVPRAATGAQGRRRLHCAARLVLERLVVLELILRFRVC
jgi:hypothetical protein